MSTLKIPPSSQLLPAYSSEPKISTEPEAEPNLGSLRLKFLDAVKDGDLQQVQSMLAKRFDPNFTIVWGYAIHEAVKLDEVKALSMVDLLVNAGADINTKNLSDVGPLHVACIKDRVNVVRHLISRGADWNRTNLKLRTALHEAMRAGSVKCLELFLDMGADPDAADVDGQSLKVNTQYPAMTDFYRSWESRLFARKALEEINMSIKGAILDPGCANHFNVQSRF